MKSYGPPILMIIGVLLISSAQLYRWGYNDGLEDRICDSFDDAKKEVAEAKVITVVNREGGE